jgi:hypothetical protein
MIRSLHPVVLTGGLALLLGLVASPALAQQWRQEVEIITPVQFNDPTHILLDSLAAVLARSPTLQVRRRADSSAMSYRDLRESLYADGVDLRSATHAFIRYRFDLTEQGSGIVETIEDIYFVFRLDESREDLPILYLDTRDPAVSDLLVDRGIPSPVNMLSVTPFRRLLAYPSLTEQHETAVVAFGGRTVRAVDDAQQSLLLGLVEEHMSVGTYVLTTAHQRMAAVTR